MASGKAPAKKPEEQEEGSPAWMTTFGDMMTLLLTFFVLLVSMSVIREEEFEAARKSLREVFLYGYWKPTQTLIRNLIDIASKGGNYLLNVGPTNEGLIPDPSITRLKEVGRWMKLKTLETT